MAYKGYLIKKTLTGDIFIEKDGHLISWAKSEEKAKEIIDMLRGQAAWLERTEHRKNAGTGKAFTFHGSATSKLAAKRLEAKTPGSFIEKRGDRYYILKPKRIGSRPRNVRNNSPKLTGGAVKIYGRCLRIEAMKTSAHTYGGDSSKPGQKYFHDFTTKNAMIYGLPDGSLLIKAK